jgi:peroxiredoxin
MLPEYTLKTVEKGQLTFPVLNDPGNKVAAQFNLTHTLPDELQQVYLQLGIDLPRFNGDASWCLPMPARYVVDTDGVIRVADISIDHTVRTEPTDTVAALMAL